jgi:hypothetical protein
MVICAGLACVMPIVTNPTLKLVLKVTLNEIRKWRFWESKSQPWFVRLAFGCWVGGSISG